MSLTDYIKKMEFNVNFVWLIRMFRRYVLGIKPVERNLGLLRDKYDPRDILYRVKQTPAPLSTELKNYTQFFREFEVYDQGDTGSCTGNMLAGMFRKSLHKNGQPDFLPSRFFAYYNARSEENKGVDSGATIRDVIKGAVRYGVCSESTWMYDPRIFTTRPSEQAYLEALDHQVERYERLPQTKEAIKEVVSQGYPLGFGMMLYSSFMSDKVSKTGIVPMPNTCWEELIGGHALWIIDYDEDGVWITNSWNKLWGKNGIAHVPWKYILNPKMAFDFWVIYLTE